MTFWIYTFLKVDIFTIKLKGFPRILILPVLTRVNELVIPGGIRFLRWIPRPWASDSWRNKHSSGGFLVHVIANPSGVTIYPVFTVNCHSPGNWRASVGGSWWHSVWFPQTATSAVITAWLMAVRRIITTRKILRIMTTPGFLTLKDVCR
jgi:hypothetical protein